MKAKTLRVRKPAPARGFLERSNLKADAAANVSRNETLPFEIKRILVSTDFSKESLKGVRYAAAMAQKFGATIELVFVVETASLVAGLDSSILAMSDKDVAQKAHDKLVRLAEKEFPAGVVVFPKVRVGHGAMEICDLARSFQADLIIISTHGYTGLKRTFMGSTAERVVRYAPCPVLVVREQERDFVSS
jgi:universal stress protein A